jgi:hypothetical protein
VLWLHLVARADGPLADRVLLVAPPSPQVIAGHREIAAFAPPEPDPTRLTTAAPGGTRLVGTDDDPYCPQGVTAAYGGLHLDTDVVPGGGHLDLAAGYGAWPGALAWCLDPSTRLVARPADAVVPDGKDWTWVLQRPCPECGLDTRSIDPRDVADLVRANAASWTAVLRRPDVRTRPAPGVWSTLEYACHVRDVFRLYDRRLRWMLTEDDPLYPDWDQDATAVEQRYAAQDPAAVAAALGEAAAVLAARFDGVRGEQWQRPGRRSDGARFSVATFARYLAHDPVHHLHDVRRALDTADAPGAGTGP